MSTVRPTPFSRDLMPVGAEPLMAGRAGRRTAQHHKLYLMQRVRFSPDEENRQCRRRGLRCKMALIDDTGGPDAQPQSIPGDCFNISNTGLYGIIPIGFGVGIGQRYTFQLTVGEPGPEPGSFQVVTQQGLVVRSELLMSSDGQTDRTGIGVQLVGQRSGLIPMPS